MQSFLRQIAKKTVASGHLITAAFCFGLGVIFFLAGLWVMSGFGCNWITLGILGFFGLMSYGCWIGTSEAYLAARPPLRPDEIFNDRQSRSIYIPKRREDRDPHRKARHK